MFGLKKETTELQLKITGKAPYIVFAHHLYYNTPKWYLERELKNNTKLFSAVVQRTLVKLYGNDIVGPWSFPRSISNKRQLRSLMVSKYGKQQRYLRENINPPLSYRDILKHGRNFKETEKTSVVFTKLQWSPRGTSVENGLFTKTSLLEVQVCCACSERMTLSLVKSTRCQAQLPFTQDAPIIPMIVNGSSTILHFQHDFCLFA